MSIIAGYCVLAVLVLRWLFRKAPKKYTYLLWLIVAFRLVCPLTVDSAFSIFNLKLLPESMKTESEVSGDRVELPGTNVPNMKPEAGDNLDERPELGGSVVVQPGVFPEQDSNLGEQLGTGPEIGGNLGQQPEVKPEIGGSVIETPGDVDQTPQTLPLREIDWMMIGAWVWMAGMICLTATMVTSWIRLKLRVRTAVKVRTRVFETDAIDSAFVLGIRKPTIYLPVGLDRQEQAWVLLHETSHIRRKDYLVKIIATVLTIVYWFHPLVWVAWFGMCRDMEMSCDEMALEGADAELRKAYSRTLLTVATQKRINWNAITAFGEVSVKSRIKHVLSFKKPAVWMGAVFAVVLVAVLVVFGTNGQAFEPDGNPSTEAEEPTSAEAASSTEREEITENGEMEEERDTEGTTEEMPEESTEEPTTSENVAPDAWKEVAWQAFLNYDEANPYKGEYGEFRGAAKDLDGDGVEDRIFWHKIQDYYGIEYLLLSDGTMMELGEIVGGGNKHEAFSLDVEGDGVAEIAIARTTMSTGHDFLSIELLKKTETGWQATPFVYADGREEIGFETVRIPLVLKKTDDTHLLITQPECGVTVEQKIIADEFDHWGFRKGEYGPIDSAVSSSDIRIIIDPASGKPILQLVGNVGDKWVSNFVIWEMIYEDGAWKVISFANMDETYYN